MLFVYLANRCRTCSTVGVNARRLCSRRSGRTSPGTAAEAAVDVALFWRPAASLASACSTGCLWMLQARQARSAAGIGCACAVVSEAWRPT